MHTPSSASSGRMRIHSCLSSTIPSSSSLQIIPFETSPLIFVFLMTNSGVRAAPIIATGTLIPGFTFGAPHTICTVSPCTDTWQRLSLSASGCFLTSRISPINTFSRWAPSLWMSSTSAVCMMSFWAVSSGELSSGKYDLRTLWETFIESCF